MVKEEWKNLWKNKVLLVVLLAIILIPTIYATLFLGSMWDPYGKLEELPVAVVNEDQEVEFKGNSINVGKELVDSLRENKSLKFDFVDEAKGTKGLRKGNYYMMITIPEDFSVNASTVLEDSPKKMELSYEVNPGTNYIASKLSESAITKIKAEVSQEVTKSYTKVIFEEIEKAKEGMIAATNGTKELLDGGRQLIEGNQSLNTNLDVLKDSSKTFENGSKTLYKGLQAYTDGVGQVGNGVKSLKDGTSKLEEQAKNGTDQLVTGVSDLKKGITDYTNGVATAATGTHTLTENNRKLTEGSKALSNGMTSLGNGSDSVKSALNQISEKIGDSNSKENQQQLTELLLGMDQFKEGMNQLNNKVQNFSIPDFGKVVEGVKTPVAQLGKNVASSSSSLKKIEEGLSVLGKENPELLNNEEFKSLNNEIGNLGGNLTGMGTQLGTISKVGSSIPTSSEISNQVESLKSAVRSLQTNGAQIIDGSKNAIFNMENGLESIKNALDRKGNTPDSMGIIQGMDAISSGVEAAKSGASDLEKGITNYTDGVSKVDDGLSQLSSNNTQLTTGSNTLGEGIGTLATGLSKGMEQMTKGVGALDTGATTLLNKKGDILEGSRKLTSGASKISVGAGKLADGGGSLLEGIHKETDGIDTLHGGLTDGVNTMGNIGVKDETINMFASPVQVVENKLTTVEDNGHAMAAYMMSVALWVGCIAFSIMYPLTQYKGELKNGVTWWFSKATVVYPVALAMALVMLTILHFTNGFQPVNWGKTILVSCFAAVAFMSILYFFNVWLGKIGSFLMLIFMVVQLAGSAGTYPIELSGRFVSKIHKWLPFSYTVNAFRSTISGGENIGFALVVLGLLSVIFTGLTVMLFHIRGKRMKAGKAVVYDYLEKGGLA